MGKEKPRIIHSEPDAVIRAKPDEHDEPGMAEAIELLRVLAMLVYNTIKSIWMSAADFNETVTGRMGAVDAALAACEEIRFSVRDDKLMVNGSAVEISSHHLPAFLEQLARLEVTNFVLKKGLTQLELTLLLDLLTHSQPEMEKKQGFEQAVKDAGLKFVEVRKIIIKEVTESDVILEKKHVDEEAVERKKEAEAEVLEWLSGDEAEQNAAAHADHMHEISKDPAMMADIIVRVADKGEEAGGTEGPSQGKSAVVTSCIQQMFSGLMQHATSRTKTGKRAIKKALRQLEKELVTRMDEDSGVEVASAMHTVVEQLTEGLKVADIAAEYTKKLNQLEQSEKRILRFMKSMALDKEKSSELEDQLKEDGLDVTGWHRLLARSAALEAEAEEGDGDDSERAVAQLAYLLGHLQEKIEATSEESAKEEEVPAELTDELKEANQQVKSMVAETEKKIDSLVDAATGDLDSVDELERAAVMAGKGPTLSRKKLLKNLAEIAQQLCQPLSVITCSVEMITTLRLGEVTAPQMEMLKMAHEGAERLSVLVDGLMRISGMPPELSPDHELLDEVGDPIKPAS